MEWTTRLLIYPDGDQIEVEGEVPFNQLLDLNGAPLRLPLKSKKILAYRVYSVRRAEGRGETRVFYYLELVGAQELASYVD